MKEYDKLSDADFETKQLLIDCEKAADACDNSLEGVIHRIYINSGMYAIEQEIIKYLSLGKTHEEMGTIFGISPETVRSHVKGIFRKLDCSNAAAAVGRAYELGILRA